METLAELEEYLLRIPLHRVYAYMKQRQKSWLTAPLMVALAALDCLVAIQATVIHD